MSAPPRRLGHHVELGHHMDMRSPRKPAKLPTSVPPRPAAPASSCCSRPDCTGPDCTGPDGTGLDGSGLDGSGLDGSGLDGAGLDGAGLDCTGPESAPLSRSPSAGRSLSAPLMLPSSSGSSPGSYAMRSAFCR